MGLIALDETNRTLGAERAHPLLDAARMISAAIAMLSADEPDMTDPLPTLRRRRDTFGLVAPACRGGP